MEYYVQVVIDTLSLGGLYALMALGLAIVFGIMRLVNFAHGEIIMIVGYALFYLAGLSPWLVVGGGLLISVIVALFMERVAFRPLRGAEASTLMIASFGVSYLLQNLAVAVFSGFPRSFDVLPTLAQPITVASIQLVTGAIITIAVTIGVLILLTVFLLRTSLGIQMRAAAEDVLTAQLLGVNTNKIITIAFVISGALAGIVSLLYLSQIGLVGHLVGLGPLMVAFVAIVLGGMGSLHGAVIGGFVVGILQSAIQVVLPVSIAGYRQAFVFGVVFFILLFRPQGILPRETSKRRA